MSRVQLNQDVEVLVHISAPSNRESEARWRDLAQSYLNFEPVSRRKLDIVTNQSSFSQEDQDNTVNTSRVSLNASHVAAQPVSGHIKRKTHHESADSIKYNDPINNDVEENEQISGLEKCPTEAETYLTHDTALGSSPFLRVSSYKLKNCLNLDVDNYCSNLQYTRKNDPEEFNTGMKNFQIHGHVDYHSSKFETERPKTIQHDLVSSQASTSSKRRMITVDAENIPLNSSISCNLQDTTVEKRLCVEPLYPQGTEKTKSIIFSSENKASSVLKFNQGVKMGKWSKALEIRSPPPPIGNSTLCPEDLITQPLRVLAERGRLEKNFQPTETKRDLQPTERGYWYIICSSWDRELRIRCWNCLGTYIEKDNSAGWGVWCVRDENFEFIRVYSWGIIIGHIYLLLRMASEGKVSKTGACWIDADGQEIVKICSNK
ncbi:hypothetical protein OnM2_020050 [Erysiphe neolycopersici]|uniref:Uncharacterized protein n=1 Tax=Erysiphe neolycopersici TaxID=212602 RepID=A0A420I3J2_9PEZI|nr:hypothetical protein OnM2_020050 [Erysiphe neolycopersici]